MSSYAGLAFPKPSDKKKRKQHMKSIMHQKDGTCYLCAILHDDYRYHSQLEEHHVFNGYLRNAAEANGLKVFLCPFHHQNSAESVHGHPELMRILKEDAQRAYEANHSHESWMATFGKNYI